MLEFAGSGSGGACTLARDGSCVLLVLDDRRQPLGLAPLYLRDEGMAHPSRCLRTVGFWGPARPSATRWRANTPPGWQPPWAMPIVTSRVLAAADGQRRKLGSR